jgi:DNA recombination protein RmuC
VELAGMVNRVDFAEQAQTEVAGSKLRPDLVVHLPGGGSIVVDSKVPLQAFLDANEATTEAERAVALARHASQLRKHVVDLGSKEYWKQFTTAPEFVVCFIPGEPLANAAFEQDPTLMDDALALNVIPATPTNLVTLLKTVAHNWRYADVEEKAKRVIDLGVELYERLGVVGSHMDQLARSLAKTVEHYNALAGSVESRLLVTGRALKETEAIAGSAQALSSPNSVDVVPRTARAAELLAQPEAG